MYQVHLTKKSANAKTGPIPVSTTTASTCPSSCPLNGNGCYAQSGPLALHWRKVTNEERGTNWSDFCSTIAALPEGQVWRHNQAGDLPGDGSSIDGRALAQLVEANAGKKGFTYTHYDPLNKKNAKAIKHANDNGFTINVSANNLKEADRFRAAGLRNIVVVVPEGGPKLSRTDAQHSVVVCPATYKDTSCAECKLCSRDRDAIVAFPVHGSQKKKATIAIKAI